MMARLVRTAGVVALALLAAAVSFKAVGTQAEKGRLVPAPASGEPAATGSSEVAVLAAGCFWGVQGVYQHVTGVTSAISGYAGGDKTSAEYELVGTGRTGHAESVEVTFDPRVISFGRILQIYFSVVHDPTQLNRQGPDVGTQYRSTIFAVTPAQAVVARAYIDQLTKAHVFDKPIATTIESGRPFYRAEDYHQDFLELHPTHGYIVYNDLPKIDDLKRLFPQAYRAKPVLVAAAR